MLDAPDIDPLQMAGHLDNPAGRLLDLFERARSVQNQSTALQVWARVFDASINTPKGEYEVIQKLYGIVELDLEEQISFVADDDERAAFMRPLSRFRNVILISNAANTSTNIQQITEGDLIVLEFCSRYLHNHRAEAVADRAQLEDLTTDLSALFDGISGSTTIEAELKEFLLSQIETVRRGIQEYRIGGMERLREALGDVLGYTIVKRDIVANNKDSEELRRFTEIADKLIAIIEFSSKTTKLIGSVSSVLPHLLAAFKG